MSWPSARYATATRGGAWGWDKMNGIQDWLLRPAGLVADDFGGLDELLSADSSGSSFDPPALVVNLPGGFSGLVHMVAWVTGATQSGGEFRACLVDGPDVFGRTLASETIATSSILTTKTITFGCVVSPSSSAVSLQFLRSGDPTKRIEVHERKLWVRTYVF